jgi:hypothetical protein
MKQKIIVCQANRAEDYINPMLEQGWVVVHCISESIALTSDSRSWAADRRGDIIFILQKPE